MTATYTKLRDGSWGIRVAGSARAGATITVHKKSGETRSETVARVLWTGKDSRSGETVSLCAIGRESAACRGKTWDPNAFNGYGARRGRFVRECETGGNCSSFGSGRSCGGYDCDGY